LRQSSGDIHSNEECTIFISQARDICGRSLWIIRVNKHTILDWLVAHRRTVGNPCNWQLCTTEFILCRTCMLAVMHAILTWSRQYIPQDLPLLFIIFFLRTFHFVSLSSSLHFHSSKSWLRKHLSKVRVEQNWPEQRALHPILLPLRPNRNVDTTWFTATLQMQPPRRWPWTHSYKLSLNPEAVRIASCMQSDVSVIRSR